VHPKGIQTTVLAKVTTDPHREVQIDQGIVDLPLLQEVVLRNHLPHLQEVVQDVLTDKKK
jgi:hypothetical protein